jgi:hypothetical protein
MTIKASPPYFAVSARHVREVAHHRGHDLAQSLHVQYGRNVPRRKRGHLLVLGRLGDEYRPRTALGAELAHGMRAKRTTYQLLGGQSWEYA